LKSKWVIFTIHSFSRVYEGSIISLSFAALISSSSSFRVVPKAKKKMKRAGSRKTNVKMKIIILLLSREIIIIHYIHPFSVLFVVVVIVEI
jgi:hypothetical protein